MKLNFHELLTEKRVLSFPPLIYLVVLFLIPMVLMMFVAFREPGPYGGLAPLMETINGKAHLNVTLENFKFALTSKFIWMLFIRSIFFSVITTILCLCIGYPLALLIAKSNKKIRDTLLLLVIIPFWSCFLIRIYAWMMILGPDSFVSHGINSIVKYFGFEPINLLYSSISVVICLVYINLPFMVLPLYANLEKHSDELIEASRDLGATRFQSFWQITIPLSIPGILAGSGLVFIPSIGMFVVPELIGNNCSLMIGNLIKQQFLQIMNWPLGSVTSIIMSLLVLLIALIVALIVARNSGSIKYARK